MARPRQPIDLIVAKGKKHLGKDEIEARKSQEPTVCTDGIAAPSFLTAGQKKAFDRIAEQLQKINIMGETDTDTLARYVIAQDLYEQAVKDLRAAQKQRPKDQEAQELILWADLLDKLDKRQDRYFRQAQTAASALGLTISSRCKLVVPVSDEPEKVNKFEAFERKAEGADIA